MNKMRTKLLSDLLEKMHMIPESMEAVGEDSKEESKDEEALETPDEDESEKDEDKKLLQIIISGKGR